MWWNPSGILDCACHDSVSEALVLSKYRLLRGPSKQNYLLAVLLVFEFTLFKVSRFHVVCIASFKRRQQPEFRLRQVPEFQWIQLVLPGETIETSRSSAK